MVLDRIRNFLRFRRETEFRNGEPASEQHQPFNPTLEDLEAELGLPSRAESHQPSGAEVSEQGYRAYLERLRGLRGLVEEQANDILRTGDAPASIGEAMRAGAEVHFQPPFMAAVNMRGARSIRTVLNGEEEPIMVQRCYPGSIIYANVESDNPIRVGDLLQTNENGNLVPIPFDVLEYGNVPENAVARAMEHLENQPNPVIMRVLVNQPIDITLPLEENEGGIVMETAEQVINEITEGVNFVYRDMARPSIAPNKYDKDFPHQCFKCKQQLQYKHALGKAKQQGYTEKQHKKMWKSAIVEYYCCMCYERKQRANTHFTGISTPNLEAMRQLQEAAFRWGPGHPVILPRDAVENIEMIPRGYRRLRIIGENDETLYQDTPPEPVFIDNFEHESPEPHRQHYFEINVRIIGDPPSYCNHSARRLVNTPLPENHRDIHLTQDFPEITDNEKLVAIAQLYTRWLMRTPEIRIRHPLIIPDIVERHIQLLLQEPQPMTNHYEQVINLFERRYQSYLVHQDSMAFANHQEHILWRGYHIEHNPINSVRVYGGIVEGERLEATADNLEAQENGIQLYVSNHPEITDLGELRVLAQDYLLNRRGVRGRHFSEAIVDCTEHEFNGMGICVHCGLSHIDRAMQDQMRDMHIMTGEHNFNANLVCTVCGLSSVEIDRRSNIYLVPRSRN